MPRRKGPKVTADDWRSDTQRVVDAALAGTWWRCRSHGLTTDPLLLGPSAYCSRDECSEAVLLVHRVSDDKGDARWNDGPKRKPGRPKRVDQVDEHVVEAGPADDAEPEPSEDDGGPGGPEADEPADELVQDDEPPMPELEVDVPEPTIETRPGARTFIVQYLARQPGRSATRAAMLAAFIAARPDLGDRATRNFDAGTAPLRRQGKILHTGKGWRLPDEAAHVPAERNQETSAPDLDAARDPVRAPRRPCPFRAPPAPSSEVAKGEKPSLEPTPTGEHPCPPVPTGNDGSPLAPVVDETNGFPPSPSTGSAERNHVRVRLTDPMRERLEQLRDEGFSGHTVEDVAERFLARALRAFTAAN